MKVKSGKREIEEERKGDKENKFEVVITWKKSKNFKNCLIKKHYLHRSDTDRYTYERAYVRTLMNSLNLESIAVHFAANFASFLRKKKR